MLFSDDKKMQFFASVDEKLGTFAKFIGVGAKFFRKLPYVPNTIKSKSLDRSFPVTIFTGKLERLIKSLRRRKFFK